jgi:hypothetical protein
MKSLFNVISFEMIVPLSLGELTDLISMGMHLSTIVESAGGYMIDAS